MKPGLKPPLKKGPKVLDPERQKSRSRGALLGLAVGDALGATHALKLVSTPDFTVRLDGPQVDILGGGRFQVARGQVTDDAQMASCLASSLRELHRYDAEDALQRYLTWEKHAFDIGPQMKAVFDHVRRGMLARDASREVWTQSAKKAAGSESLARTAPIGVYFAKDRATRVRASLEDSALTHYSPRCQLACVAFNGALAAALISVEEPDPKKMIAAAVGDLTFGAAELGKQARDDVRDIREALDSIREDLAAALEADPLLYGPDLFLQRHLGQVRIPFRVALWELVHAPSFEAALIDVVNRGGDCDTSAALTGALLGAVHGEPAISSEWRTLVLEALSGRSGPLYEVYHPTQLLLLVD